MIKTLRLTSAFVALITILAAAGCMPELSSKTDNRPTTATNSNATSATTTTPEPAPEKIADTPPISQPVTLPVLDAFFAQEDFAADLKSKLQLTDEQVNKLRRIAREQTSILRESDNPDQHDGRATPAREDAYEKS